MSVARKKLPLVELLNHKVRANPSLSFSSMYSLVSQVFRAFRSLN